MNQSYPVLLVVTLVLLRLAIGWHFYIEGRKKVETLEVDKSQTTTPYNSAGYLRGAAGPVAPYFRWLGDDPDLDALARLEVGEPGPEHADGKKALKDLIPPALDKHYQDYFDRFVEHLKLGDAKVTVRYRVRVPFAGDVFVEDEQLSGKGQLELAQARLDQAREKAVRWLLGLDRDDAVDTDIVLQTGPVKIKKLPPKRIEEYKDKLLEIQAAEGQEATAFEKSVRDPKDLRTDAARMRTALMRDLDKILTDRLEGVLTDSQVSRLKWDPVPPPATSARLTWANRASAWGLLAIGVCLMLGLFTRMACLGGVLFLLTTYVIQPPLPGVPEPAKSEGTYLFVNKNTVELLALLVLAVTPSGRWVGLDRLLYNLNPFRRRQPREQAAKAAPTQTQTQGA